MPTPTRRVLNAGDSAFVVEFGSTIDQALFAAVEQLDAHLHRLAERGVLRGLRETVPTFRSLAVLFDPLLTTPAELLAAADAEPMNEASTAEHARRTIDLPMCSGASFGPDCQTVAESLDMSVEALLAAHRDTDYTVYMLGFLPGFAFMGDLPTALRLPRRKQPRTRVPRGSVAIAKQLTAVYPWDSPGGWHLIGYSPVPLFDAAQSTPALLRAGDRVRFRAVDTAELDDIEARLAEGRFDRDALISVDSGAKR